MYVNLTRVFVDGHGGGVGGGVVRPELRYQHRWTSSSSRPAAQSVTCSFSVVKLYKYCSCSNISILIIIDLSRQNKFITAWTNFGKTTPFSCITTTRKIEN